MSSTTQAAPPSKKMLWTGRILSALPVLLMLTTGAFGLFKPDAARAGFVHYGYPEGAFLPISIVEIVCALIYAIPQSSGLGAILLTGYLGGAVATHVHAGEPFYLPVIVGVVVWGGLFLRDERLRALIPLRT